MIRVELKSEIYRTAEWHEAWVTKNGRTRLVLVGLPYVTYKPVFKRVAASKGFYVQWR